MDALEGMVPRPKNASLGSLHVDLSGCRVQGEPATARANVALRRVLGSPSGDGAAVGVAVRLGGGLPAEGYALSVDRSGVVVVGADPAGAFYGVQTLLALVGSCAEHRLCVPEVRVRDWPDLALRGTIEGFYGTPWSHADRLGHLRFSGRRKLNTYVYAPKDDPFHRERWREPYPSEELVRLAELVEEAAAQHVRFVFALSPGLSMVYSDAVERVALRAKAEQVWEVGVRDYALLFDDIPFELAHRPDVEAFGAGAGACAVAHAAVCRDFAETFLAVRGAERPLTMVPTAYAGNGPSAYRDRLAAELPQDVLVWWTGSDVVVGTITADDVVEAAASFGHRLALWDNFPVNDFDFSRVFLGPLVGRDTALGGLPLEGITANPMVQATASRLGLATVADYAWNLAAYDPARSHANAVRLVPGAVELLPLVEACSSWPPGADQSPRLSRLCLAVLDGGDAEELRVELGRLAALPVDVPGPLARELAPWVLAARDMGAAGLAALDLLSGSGVEVGGVVAALVRAEGHQANVLRSVIPLFVRRLLERMGHGDVLPGPAA
ncbi:beta-N-acetylhexosaminidase family protein [Actinomadura hibisca]|uniref:beta-N-acetylhexosaminidase family protein n=1 Tax=Actinomadura hibisca TaxID=68565 RepID=UPI00147097BF|nr:beta-N-acetylglucosaminidase domain-containing protein [Actinomadura hibisca]